MIDEQSEWMEVTFQAHLRGSEPMLPTDERDEIWPTEWVLNLADKLERGEDEAAQFMCQAKATAELLCAEAAALLGDGDSITATAIDLADIRVDRTHAGPVVRVHRWTATFRVKVLRDVVRSWCSVDEASGQNLFAITQYEDWLEENGIWGLQDAVRFYLYGVCYELDGMGEQSCLPDEDSIMAALS